MNTSRFKALHTPTSPPISPIASMQKVTPFASTTTNSRWKEPEGHTNPFRNRRFSHDYREKHNGDGHERPGDRGFEAFSRRRRDGRRSPPPKNTRWQKEESSDNIDRSQNRPFRRNNFQKGKYGDRRYTSRTSFRRPPKPVFKLEEGDFPALGAAPSADAPTRGKTTSNEMSGTRPIGGAFKMDFKRVAEAGKDLPAPKHVPQLRVRIPRAPPKLEPSEDDGWNTDDEVAAREDDPSDDEQWPAKGGYID